MPTAPYASVLTAIDGGTPAAGFITPVAGGASVQLAGASISGWQQARWELFGYPRGWTAPTGWSTDPSGIIYSTDITPTAIVLDKASTRWGKWVGRLQVNQGVKNGQAGHPDMVDETWGWEVLSPALGQREIAAGEGTQVDPMRAWTDALQRNAHTLENGDGTQGYAYKKTTGAARTILQTYTMPQNSAVVMEVYALGKKIGAVDCGFFAYRHMWYRAAAAPVAIGVLEDLGSRPNGTTWSADVANASGNDITSGITGQVATNIEWITVTKIINILDTSV